MKKLTTYCSWTGNTKKIAQAIHEQIGGDIIPMEEATNWEEYDFIALGFFVDKGFAGGKGKDFLEQVKNKKVGLFATLGAEPESEHAKAVMEKGRELMRANNNTLLCEFICQGAIDPNIIQKMRDMAAKQGANARHPITPEREKRWADATTHPDEKDVANAKKAFSKIKNL
ncbi:MAG: flavodoxin [Proteobacteria bacterium]|nr:MAG: flavodoxin [Pseudomonadota bacterium]